MRPPRRTEPLAVAVAFAVALAATSGRAADELAPGSGGALRVVADPPRLVLGQDAAAELTISAPPEVTELAVVTSAGRIEALRRLPDGGFAARLRAPAERYPQVAIVAATGRAATGPVDGWLAVPLFGQGDAHVRGDPGARITLRIGERTFGPRSAGTDGVALIPVVVPPGVRQGHHGFRPVDLHVPDTSLLLAVADRAAARADRTEQIRLLAYVVAPHGAARRGDVPTFEPSRGSVAVAPREPGAFEAIWTLPPGPASEERVVVRLPGSSPSRAVLRVAVAAGTPTTIAVAFDRDHLVAEEPPREVGVVVRVLDAAGNPTAAAVELSADGGALTRAVERQPGVFEARLTVSPRFQGRGEVVVAGRVEALGISGARALPLRPAAPASAQLEDAVLVADGARETSLRVEVRDRFENPVSATPSVRAASGRVAGVAAEGPGVYLVRYVGPAVDARQGEVITVEVGGVRAARELALVPPRAPVGVLATLGIAPGGPPGLRGGLGLELDGPRWRAVDLAWRIDAELTGWSGDPTFAGAPSEGGRAFAFLAGASVRRDLALGPTVWLRAAAGVLVARARDGGRVDAGAGPAGRLAVGAGLHRRWGMPFLEIGWLVAAGPASAAVPPLAISAGFRFDLPRSHGDHPDRR